MSEKHEPRPTGTKSGDESVPYEVQAKPSTIIKSCQKTITIDGKTYDLTLVSMRRTFLLVVRSKERFTPSLPPLMDDDDEISQAEVSDEALVESFMNVNPPLRGLSLAIGEHSTCLIPSENSLVSSSLATRLSKKLNSNRPVYVASDIQAPTDTLDVSDLTSRLYLKIFQFVGANYQPLQSVDLS